MRNPPKEQATIQRAQEGHSASICGALTPDRLSYVLGFDLGFAESPTAAALLGFDSPQPRLIAAREFRPRRGGGWQGRQYDILDQVQTWLIDDILLRYEPILLAYSCAHLRMEADAGAKAHRKSQHERAASPKALNPQTALKLSELAGGIRGLAVGFGLPCIGVQESESKTALTRNPQASKQEMIDMALRVFGQELTEHEADGAAHAMAGEANYRREHLIRKATR